MRTMSSSPRARVVVVADDAELRSRITEMLAPICDVTAIASEVSRANDHLLAMVGHELRNPLTPIRTSVQVLRMMDRPSPELLGILDRGVEQMIRVVDDLVDITRVMRGKLELRRERIQLAGVIARAREVVAPLAARHEARLEMGVVDGLAVDGDAQRLRQAFANLVTSSIQNSPTRSRIRIDAERAGGCVRARICNDAADGREPGLGFALARGIIELHGGTVATPSHDVIAVELPLAADVRELRVLVVEHSRDVARTTQIALEALGCRVEIAHDAAAALALIERFEPALALVDVGLPGMDACDLAGRLRARGPVRLVATSGYGHHEARDRTRDAGFELHLIKPVDLVAIQRLLVELRT
jgi:CheY-like chemotaxis protein